ncbi:MAG: integrin alpha, partial [Pseudomonadota bacterium]
GILVQNIDAPALDQFFVAQGSVDLQNQFSGGAGPELDLDGTATTGVDDPAGQITSNESFTFQPGFVYTLSFDLRSIADDEIVALSVGSLLNETVTSGSLERFTIEFQATSTETAPLSFTNLGANDNLGAAISNISLSESAAVEIDGASGNLLFDPSIFNDALGSGQSQVVSIDYSVSDGTEDVSGSVVVTVNGTGSDIGAGYGSRVFGAEAGDQSGQSVSNIGDINGDGFDDIVIGAPLADYSGTYGYSNTGAAFVVFGNGDMDTLAEIDLGNLDGLNGFRVQYGYSEVRLGLEVSGVGDFNGDGFDDFAAHMDSSGDASAQTVIIYGSDTIGSSGTFGLFETDAFYNGYAAQIAFGLGSSGGDPVALSGIGDINGDGFDDIAIGVDGADAARLGIGTGLTSLVAVVFGTDAGIGAYGSTDLSQLDGSNGFFVRAPDGATGSFAASITGGDINGDMTDDIVISDLANNAAYVIFGSATIGGTGEFVIDDDGAAIPNQLDGTNGFTVNFAGAGLAPFGSSVDAGGDINGDDIDDLVIGSISEEVLPGQFVTNAVVIQGSTDLPISTGIYDFGSPSAEGFIIGVD